MIVTCHVMQKWSGGLTGRILVTNAADRDVVGWSMEFDFAELFTWITTGTAEKLAGNRWIFHPTSQRIAAQSTVSINFGAMYESPQNFKTTVLGTQASSSAPQATPVPRVRPLKYDSVACDVATLRVDLSDIFCRSRMRYLTLGHITGHPDATGWTWRGKTVDIGEQLGHLRQLGCGVCISFLSSGYEDLACVHTTASDLHRAYEEVVDALEETHIDFDMRGNEAMDRPTVLRRNKAIELLQKTRNVVVSLTMNATTDGISDAGLYAIQTAPRSRVKIDRVRIVTTATGAKQTIARVKAQIGDIRISLVLDRQDNQLVEWSQETPWSQFFC